VRRTIIFSQTCEKIGARAIPPTDSFQTVASGEPPIKSKAIIPQ